MELLRKSPIIAGKLKNFFTCLSAGKGKILEFKQKSARDKLLKCFYRWKFYNCWSRMESYRHMYEDLGCEISHVSELQREVGREKELLVREIEEKERLLREWERKCEEYEYVVHSKDLKYEKLKDIYAEMASQQEMGATAKLTRERAAEEEIYLKYLPPDLKPTPTKYSFHTRPADREELLKGRAYSHADSFRLDLPREADKAGTYAKSRETFLSSFKRF